MKPIFYLFFFVGFAAISTSLIETHFRSANNLKKYPIPVPIRPYPVATDNSYRSDNAWGEIRTASEGSDHFRIEITKEDGSREGIVLHKSPDGKIQRQYYEAGKFGYRVKRSNSFVESAPKRIIKPVQSSNVENEDQILHDDNLSNTVIVTSLDGKNNAGKFAAGSVRQAAFSYQPETTRTKPNNRRSDGKLTAGSQSPIPLPPDSPILQTNSFNYYQNILSAVRPTSNFINDFFTTHPFPNQISVSRPQTISLAGVSGQSEAVTSGTALAGPGSTSIAAPESISIAGPGGFAFSSSTGISSVNTNFDNNGNNGDNSIQTTSQQDTSGPIVIEESKNPTKHHFIPRPPFNIRPRPVPSHITREKYISRVTNPMINFDDHLFGQRSYLNPFSRQSPDDASDTFNPWSLLSNAIYSGRGNPTPYTGQDRNNVVYNNGRTVISPADSNVALFYHHNDSPFVRNSFTFQKHGVPSFYYFQY